MSRNAVAKSPKMARPQDALSSYSPRLTVAEAEAEGGAKTSTVQPGTMPVVSASQHTAMHEGQDIRDEAYRIVAELLVGFRRIVHRALLRVCGNDWFEQGCPHQVRLRMLERQEVERGVDRWATETDDVFGHATFADLAEIIEFLEPLGGLLRPLALSPDRLCADLRILEELRIKVADARAVSETEQMVLVEMRLRLREKMAGARRRARPDEENPDNVAADVERAPDAPEITREIVPEITQVVTPEVTQEVVVPGDLPAGEPADASDAAVDEGRAAPPAPEPRRPTAVAEAPAAAPRPIGFVDRGESVVLGGAPTPVGLVKLDRDDIAVLRELRREIIAVAEAAYGHSDRIAMKVWTGLWDSGWFSRKMERYGLGEVATFYAVIEQYLERRSKGYDRETMRTFLADRELAKILLRLRELFLRLRV